MIARLMERRISLSNELSIASPITTNYPLFAYFRCKTRKTVSCRSGKIDARMKLSIIICTRNRANFLAPMLDAIRLLESEQEFEVLLVDNASTDHTGEIVKDAARAIPSVRAVCVERIGLGKARDAEIGRAHV